MREWWGGYPWIVNYYSWASWREKPSHFWMDAHNNSNVMTFDGESQTWQPNEALGPDGVD